MRDNRDNTAALRYRRGEDSAPIVVAKGSGYVAKGILSLARKNGVPVREDRNLIELLSIIDCYEEIPNEMCQAVAEILAYTYKVSAKL